MPTCRSCGSNVSRHDSNCSYCAAENANFQPIDTEINTLMAQASVAFQGQYFHEAIDAYRQALAKDPDIFAAYFYLAASLDNLNQPEEAVKAMLNAQALRPGSSALYCNLGVLYKKLGQKDKACVSFEKALDLSNSDCAIQYQDRFKNMIREELASLK